MARLVPNKATARSLAVDRVLLALLRVVSDGRFDGLLDSNLKIKDFIVYKILVNFHFLLEILHFAPVDKGQDAGTGILDGLNTLLLQVQHLLSDLNLELAVGNVLDFLPLQVQLLGLSTDEL